MFNIACYADRFILLYNSTVEIHMHFTNTSKNDNTLNKHI